MYMPFGKHYGRHVSAVPSGYLRWVLGNVEPLDPDLQDAIEAELETRERLREPWQKHRASVAAPVQVAEAARQWYRTLALEYHPDRRGGSTEGMKVVNRARELLFEMLKVGA